MIEPYYQEDGITLYNAKCEDVLPQLTERVGLVLTDPPYGIDYDPQSNKYGATTQTHLKISGDDADFDPAWLMQYQKIILWGGNCFASRLPDEPTWLVWDKVLKNDLKLRIAECEIAWTNCVGRPRVFRYLWSGAYRQGENGDFFHPTQKPIALMEWCIMIAGDEGLIFDPYCGAGATLVAAKRLRRRAVGIEMSEDYCKIAVQRLSQKELFGIENGHGT
jgi:DNA modification methylase